MWSKSKRRDKQWAEIEGGGPGDSEVVFTNKQPHGILGQIQVRKEGFFDILKKTVFNSVRPFPAREHFPKVLSSVRSVAHLNPILSK